MKAPKSVQVAKASMSDESKALEVVARKAHDDFRDKKISADECDKAVVAFNDSLYVNENFLSCSFALSLLKNAHDFPGK